MVTPVSVDAMPGWNPTATRDGMPSSRAMTAIADAKWTQYPAFFSRNVARISPPVPS